MGNGLYTKFYLGYSVCMPSLYFNRVLLVSKYTQHPDEQTRQVIAGQFNLLREQGRDNVTLIKKSVEIAENMGLATKPLPKFPNDYFDWHSHFVSSYESKFVVTTVEYHCFFFARKVTEAMVNLSLIQTALIITTGSEDKINLFQEINERVKELKIIAEMIQVPTIMLIRNTGNDCFEKLKLTVIAVGLELEKLAQINSRDTTAVDTFTSKTDFSLQDIDVQFKACVEVLKG
jgi:hypothetical protein